MRIQLKIPISSYTGYGNDGIGLTKALTYRGDDVYLLPTLLEPPVPESLAKLLTKETFDVDVSLHHLSPLELEATDHDHERADLVVGWTMWEWSNLRNLFPRDENYKKNWDILKKRLAKYDLLIAYDQNTANGLSEVYSGPIEVLQGGYDPENWSYIKRDWDEGIIRFAQLGQMSNRKDPLASISAFTNLIRKDKDFAERARLSIKTQSLDVLLPKMEEVYKTFRVYSGVWPTATVRSFYEAHHVLLAPSRGEGKNLPALEFLSTGAPVIATNWSGHTEWLDEDYSYPLDYTLAADDMYDFPETLSARASVDHLEDLMLHCFRNPEELQTKGLAGSKRIPSEHSWSAITEKLMLILERYANGN